MSEYDPTNLQERAAAVAERDRRMQGARLQEDEDVLRLMDSAWGRRMAWRLLSDAMVFKSTFSPNNAQMAFNEGKRDCGLQLLARINRLCPEKYQTMVTENAGFAASQHNPKH